MFVSFFLSHILVLFFCLSFVFFSCFIALHIHRSIHSSLRTKHRTRYPINKCPIVEDGPWLAHSLNKQITSGSIAIIHMPERGFREYCYEALDLLLNELVTVRNFKCVTVSQLQQISVQQQQQQQSQ